MYICVVYSAVQYSTVQYSTVQYSTVYSTVQYLEYLKVMCINRVFNHNCNIQ